MFRCVHVGLAWPEQAQVVTCAKVLRDIQRHTQWCMVLYFKQTCYTESEHFHMQLQAFFSLFDKLPLNQEVASSGRAAGQLLQQSS